MSFIHSTTKFNSKEKLYECLNYFKLFNTSKHYLLLKIAFYLNYSLDYDFFQHHLPYSVEISFNLSNFFFTIIILVLSQALIYLP